MPTGTSAYPASIDNLGTVKSDSDLIGQELVNASAAIENIEAELGTNPSGSSATVAARLAADETALSDHLADTTAAHAATAISFSPTGTVAATTVQAAIAEVASEAGGGTAASVTYAGGTGLVATNVEAAIDELATEKVDKDTSDVFTLTGTVTATALSHKTWAVTNVTTDRTFDANSYTTDELADALGTLASDYTALENAFMSVVQHLKDRSILG